MYLPKHLYVFYQNTFMHISKLRTNQTLINHAIKEYELKEGPSKPIGQY